MEERVQLSSGGGKGAWLSDDRAARSRERATIDCFSFEDAKIDREPHGGGGDRRLAHLRFSLPVRRREDRRVGLVSACNSD